MQPFVSEQALIQFVKDLQRDSKRDRDDAAMYAARCRAYDCGVQWIQEQLAPAGYYRITRELTDWVASSGEVRATINRVTKYIRQTTAITNPETLDVDAFAGDYAQGMGEVQVADLLEVISNAVIDDIKLVSTARRANFERVVSGDFGIGLQLETCPMIVTTPDGREVDVQQYKMRSFEFDSYRLALDPFNHDPDLRNHEFVLYSDVWTEHRIRRVFGQDVFARNAIDPKKLKTVKQLAPLEMEYFRLSNGRLYGNYYQHSGTRGAYVHQLHVKDDEGRFSIMYLLIEVDPGNFIVDNMDRPVSPFGGDGLPFIIIRAHPRSKSRQSISDVGMMLDDQDRLNLIASLYFQQMYNYTHRAKWFAHRGWFGSLTADDDIIEQFDQGVIISDRSADRSLKPPELVHMPSPDPSLSVEMRNYSEDLREQAGRPEIDQGRMKTHVSNRHATYSVERTQLVLDDRISSDVIEYEKFIGVAVGTAIIGITQGWPSMIRKLQHQGIDSEDIGLLGGVDPRHLPVKLSLRQQAIRHRSRETRRQDLFDLSAGGSIDPKQVTRILARDLDMPADELDRLAVRYARYAASRVAMGEEWVPMPLGPHGETLIEEFYRAMMDKRLARVPGALDRLATAVLDQRSAMFQERAVAEGMIDPNAGAGAPEDDDTATMNVQQYLQAAGVQV